MMQGEITQGRITRVLVLGFSLVIVLLVLGGSIAVRTILSIQRSAASLVSEERVTQRLIQELEEEQKTLSAVFYALTGDPDSADPDQVSKRLNEVSANLQHTETQALAIDPRQQPMWADLTAASDAFAAEARRLLQSPKNSPTIASRDLFRRHEQVVALISRLASRGFQHVGEAQAEIDRRSSRFNRESFALIGASLGLALVSSIFTVRMTRELFRNMAWQESELTRVSWHMLADQESIARRFSHELHDELGQTLAATKANLGGLQKDPSNPERVADSIRLVDDAIRNVRQLSQLLRPMILDDFGLDAGLRWLCEGFEQRTGITVDYESNLHSRLPDETETHLFRIAQEALTNVARHSGAKRVRIRLMAGGENIRLSIADDGKGIQDSRTGAQSLGMTGMRARARAAGGVFRLESPKEGGLRLVAEIPLPEGMEREDHEPHPHFAG